MTPGVPAATLGSLTVTIGFGTLASRLFGLRKSDTFCGKHSRLGLSTPEVRMMTTRRTLSAVLPLLAAALFCLGCDDKADPVGDQSDGLPDVVTYTQHVKPLLDASCIQCHATFRQGADRNGAPTGINFDTYSVARASADGGSMSIQAGTMPPAGGLSQYDRSLFAKWVEQGTQE
jgi:uncharacterized membrane protein